MERRRRRAIALVALSALALAPWTVQLGLTLPSSHRVHAWRAAWVGFDVLLLGALSTTAVLAWRSSRAVVLPAMASATLLACDAWFDVALDFGTPEVWGAVASAAFVELPLAGYIFLRTYRRLQATGHAGGEHCERR
ncbi:hypothetical protein [Streptacidiphilus rugosus]|uniref:hypothetical protein n=1 Tax=Streptacidiphilus rugosus TaxID=405783 RepID=UPI0007C74B44|nr:hypothetical protein [Streptacidiphilus rugosus]